MSELEIAMELAVVMGGTIISASDEGFEVIFDDRRVAGAYTRRVNQSTDTLIAERDNLTVDVRIA